MNSFFTKAGLWIFIGMALTFSFKTLTTDAPAFTNTEYRELYEGEKHRADYLYEKNKLQKHNHNGELIAAGGGATGTGAAATAGVFVIGKTAGLSGAAAMTKGLAVIGFGSMPGGIVILGGAAIVGGIGSWLIYKSNTDDEPELKKSSKAEPTDDGSELKSSSKAERLVATYGACGGTGPVIPLMPYIAEGVEAAVEAAAKAYLKMQ